MARAVSATALYARESGPGREAQHHGDGHRLVVLEQHGRHVRPAAEVVPPGRAGDTVDLVAEGAEALHVAAHGAGVHLEALRQVGPTPAGPPLEQAEEPQKAGGGVGHTPHSSPLRTGSVRNGAYREHMVNPRQMQQLAREYRADFMAAAPMRGRSPSPHLRMRQRLGRTLVGVGVRIARDSLAQPEGEQLLRRDPGPQRILVLQPRLEGRPLLR